MTEPYFEKIAEDISFLIQSDGLSQACRASPGLHSLTVFILACFVGYYVVWKVTPALHAPLMAVTNAISGVIIVGAVLAAACNSSGPSSVFGLIAIVLASVNIFGGFKVTDRMLNTFRKNKK
jgi:NAD(P) transhydrogenase subunit alpha